MTRFDAMYPACGPDCNCGMLCKRAAAIDEHYASRFAFMLECMLTDSNGHWDKAAALLDEYKAEWEKVNPSPATFMGEPMPPEPTGRLANQLANQVKTSGSPMTELHCLCGAEWEWRDSDWELVTPPRPLSSGQSQRWAVFCDVCRKEWSVPYEHSGKSMCSECVDSTGNAE